MEKLFTDSLTQKQVLQVLPLLSAVYFLFVVHVSFTSPAGAAAKHCDEYKPNSITLASSELAPNMHGASSELVRSWFEAEIWPIIQLASSEVE